MAKQALPLTRVVSRLKKRLNQISPHLVMILEGALHSYRDIKNPLRFANAATALRELLREVFEELAPDEEIKKCHWFVPDKKARDGITRKHRTLFAVYGYIGKKPFPKEFSEEVEDLARQIVKQVDTLSKFTHVTRERLATPRAQAASDILPSLQLYLQLFEAIDQAKEVFIEELSKILHDELEEIFSNELFDDLDILSTHTQPEYIEFIEKVDVESIDSKEVCFSGSGSLLCRLQYGSDGDLRRGDGIVEHESFPFSFSGFALTKDLKQVTVDKEAIQIDTDV